MTDEERQRRRDIALLELYKSFRLAWMRQGDLMRKEDRQAEQERMIHLSDVINSFEK